MAIDVDVTGTSDAILVDLVEEVTNCLHAGKQPEMERYARQYPQYIDRLQKLLPSLALFADLGDSEEHTLLESRSSNDLCSRSKDALGDCIRSLARLDVEAWASFTSRRPLTGRRAALKVLPFASMLDPRQIQRFKNEAQRFRAIGHPHIVDVFGVGCDRGVHYYAMRFIEGQTLSQMIVVK